MVFDVFSIQSFIFAVLYNEMEPAVWKNIWNLMVLLVFGSPTFIFAALYQKNIKFKAWLQTGGGLKHFPLQVLYEKPRLQTGAVLKHFPLQILYEKATLQTGAALKHFPLQIRYEKAWLEIGAALKYVQITRHLAEGLIGARSWSGAIPPPLGVAAVAEWGPTPGLAWLSLENQ